MNDSEPMILYQILQQPQSTSLRVHDVVISGNTRTRVSIIERHLRFVREAGTVGELNSALEDAQDGLERLGFFWSVQVLGDAGPAELNINIMVEELKDGRSCTSGTYVQGEEWTRNDFQGIVLNFMGRGEEVGLQICLGNKWSRSKEVSSVSRTSLGPNSNSRPRSAMGASLMLTADHSSLSQYHTEGNEVGNDLASPTNTVTPGASPPIHIQAGHSLLSVCRKGYSFCREKFSWMCNASLAGIGLFQIIQTIWKQELSLHRTFPLLFANAVLSVTVRASHLLYTGTSDIDDRVSLGGPNNMPGFQNFGVGPTDTRALDSESGRVERDSIGGNFIFSMAKGHTFDIPYVTHYLGVRGHKFVRVGNEGGLDWMGRLRRFVSDPIGFLRDTLWSTRISWGIGIVIPVDVFFTNSRYACCSSCRVDECQGRVLTSHM